MRDYADMVKIHYKYYENKKPPRLRATKQKPLNDYKKHIPKNLVELEKYSDIDSMVFKNKNNNELVVAMRGLDFTHPRDQVIGTEIFISDAYEQGGSDFDSSTKKRKSISLLSNKYGEILIKEQSKLDKLKKEYPNKKIVLAGHSRGGRKVIDLGEHNQLEYHAFQPAEMNRAGTPFLSIGTNMMMGKIVPTDKVYKELVKAYMNMDNHQGIQRIINNLFIQNYSPIQIQDKVIGSAIQSDSYQTSLGKIGQKLLMPEVVKRTVGTITEPDLMFREPSAFGKIISKEALDTQEQIEDAYKIAAKPSKEDKRQPPTKSISNIYKTSNDLVSRGYQHTKLVEPTEFSYNNFEHYTIGDHSINHFVSKKMLESTTQNKPIEEQEEQVEQEVIISEPEEKVEIYPNISSRYEVNNYGLCKKYPNYSRFCKYILR